MNTFGDRVYASRKALKFTQQELADMIGVERRMICYYEANRNKPRATALRSLAEALKVDADWLVSGTPGGLSMFNLHADQFPGSEDIIRNYQAFNGIYTVLSQAAVIAREKHALKHIAPPIGSMPLTPRNGMSDENMMSLWITDREHLDWWSLAFKLPRQSAATYWTSAFLDDNTVMVVPSVIEDHILAAANGQALGMIPEGRRDKFLPPTSKLAKDDLRRRVFNYENIKAHLANGDYPGVLGDTARVVIFGLEPELAEKFDIAKWSRKGGKIPELVFIN